jgi:hypothetical protein
VRTLSLRELNRTLLRRQLLAARRRIPVHEAIARLVALQAQYAPSPYVALWSRVAGFQKRDLTLAFADGSIVKAATLRTTLHVSTRELYPAIAAAYIETQRARAERLGISTLRAAVPAEPTETADLLELGRRVLGTDDRWAVAFAYRALPFVRSAPMGPWPHTKVPPLVFWREPLPDPAESAIRVVRDYVAAYGPASRDDIVQFTGFRIGQVAPALEGLRTFEDGQGVLLYDVARAPIAAADAPAPVRFLPAFDSVILAHRDRSRIVPREYLEVVFNKKNATTKSTFTVDGFVAGAWRIEKTRIAVEPFAPLPARVRREVDGEADRLRRWYLD